jgi:hypothetical protein
MKITGGFFTVRAQGRDAGLADASSSFYIDMTILFG